MITKKISKFIFYFIVFIFLFLVTYYFGGGYLRGNIAGSDSPHALIHIKYFFDNWPNKMLWQPQYGAGMSLIGDNWGSFWLVAITSKISSLDIFQAYRVWQILSMYMLSMGVFFLGLTLFNPLVGLFSGFFLLISQISWFWLSREGLFAFQLALSLVPFFFVFFIKYLDQISIKSRKSKLFFFLSIITLSIILWFHLVVAAALLESFFFFILFVDRKNSIKKRLVSFFQISVFSGLVSAFWIVPFAFYNKSIIAGELNYFDQNTLPTLPLLTFFGFEKFILGMNHGIWYGYFAFPVVIFLGLGLIFFLIKKKINVIKLYLFSFIFIFQASLPYIVPEIVKIFSTFFSLVNIRIVIIPLIFFPIIASLFLVNFSKTIFSFIKENNFKTLLVVLLSLGISISGLIFLDRYPEGFPQVCKTSFGPNTEEFCPFDNNLINLSFSKDSDPDAIPFLSIITDLSKDIPIDRRVDMTPYRGEMIESWSLRSKSPILQSYDYLSVIPNEFWNYQMDAFYEGKANAKKNLEIARWFGIDYLILDKQKDKYLGNFSDWNTIKEVGDLKVLISPENTSLVSLSSKPVILFLGDEKQQAYFKFWQMIVSGGLSFDDAFIVDGGSKISSFSESELKNFDLIYLWGEKYNNTQNNLDLLETYLNNGGKVFIDTGWQYTSHFWKMENLPDWFPIKKTDWINLETWNLSASGEIDNNFVSNWAMPRWDNKSWGLSFAKTNELNIDAEPILVDQNTNNVLMAEKKVGEGKIIWTGLNFVGMFQVNDFNSILLLNNIIKKEISSEIRNYDADINFSDPENIEFKFEPSDKKRILYIRESYFDSWKVSDSSRIYKAGPKLMLIFIPSSISEIRLFQSVHWSIILGGTVSIMSLLFLIIKKIKN